MGVATATLALSLRLAHLSLREPVSCDAVRLGVQPVVVVCIPATRLPTHPFTAFISLGARRLLIQIIVLYLLKATMVSVVHAMKLHKLIKGQVRESIDAHFPT